MDRESACRYTCKHGWPATTVHYRAGRHRGKKLRQVKDCSSSYCAAWSYPAANEPCNRTCWLLRSTTAEHKRRSDRSTESNSSKCRPVKIVIETRRMNDLLPNGRTSSYLHASYYYTSSCPSQSIGHLIADIFFKKKSRSVWLITHCLFYINGLYLLYVVNANLKLALSCTVW
jgi:hypothetical protein